MDIIASVVEKKRVFLCSLRHYSHKMWILTLSASQEYNCFV